MRLFFRFIRFLVLQVFRVLLRLLAAIFIFLLLPLLIALLRLITSLIFLSFRATVNGPTRFIDRLAGEWTLWLIDLGLDRDQILKIYNFCRFMVGSLVVLGWIIATLFTVAILRIVFGHFV